MARASNVSWRIREMGRDEVGRIADIDVSERGEVIYKWVEGRVEAVPEDWCRPTSYGEGWGQRVEMVRGGLDRGGMALGAFDGDRLVGFVSLVYRLAEDVAQLQALWVSAGYRRQGIAAALTDEVIRLARASGARTLYVSATPSASAQGFYGSRGFRPTEFVHRELYELEPEDIHMVMAL